MIRALLPLGALLLAALPVTLQARDYGQRGAVFPVIERDLLEQIHSRLTAMERSGETARLNQELKRRTIARVNRPDPVAGLIRAYESRSCPNLILPRSARAQMNMPPMPKRLPRR